MCTLRAPTVVTPNHTILRAWIREKRYTLEKHEPHPNNQPIIKFFFSRYEDLPLIREPEMD